MVKQKAPQSVNLISLARKIHRRSHRRLLVRDVNKTLNLLLDILLEELDNGEEIKLGKVMKLKLGYREAHKGYNGITKESYDIPAKRILKITKLSALDNVENKDPKE